MGNLLDGKGLMKAGSVIYSLKRCPHIATLWTFNPVDISYPKVLGSIVSGTALCFFVAA